MEERCQPVKVTAAENRKLLVYEFLRYMVLLLGSSINFCGQGYPQRENYF